MEKNILAVSAVFCSLACSVFMIGCGGGTEGTGGIAGDLKLERKMSALTQSEQVDMCSRIASSASKTIKKNFWELSRQVGVAIFNRYREPSTFVNDSSGNEHEVIGALRPEFLKATPASISAECKKEFDRVVGFQSTQVQCFDSSVPHPEIGYTSSTENFHNRAIYGACDLENPSFISKDVTVGQFASCLDEYYVISEDWAFFEPDCNSLYGAISAGDRDKIKTVAVDPHFESTGQAAIDWEDRCGSTVSAGATTQNELLPLVCRGMRLDDQNQETIVLTNILNPLTGAGSVPF